MTPIEIKALIKQVLDEQESRIERVADAMVNRSVRTTLVALGVINSVDVSADHLHEQLSRFQKNTTHVDKWRCSVEQVERIGWGAAITFIVGGVLGALWLGFKVLVGKG